MEIQSRDSRRRADDGVTQVVCTNVPFDAREASRFVDAGCCVDPATGLFRGWHPGDDDAATADGRFRTALRVDALLAGDWATVAAALRARGLDATLGAARLFLTAWARRYGAEYLMASTPGDLRYAAGDAALEPGWPSATRLVDEVLVPVARDLDLPLALKLGCVRRLAPDLAPCGGGDGLRRVDLRPLARLLTAQPRLKVLATLLGRADQHEACVLAQKFPNLHLYGCWWYCNNPSIIRELTSMRLEMLGTAFTAQHSDCRVLDQLVYKWRHSRAVIAEALAAQYAHLLGAGWTLTRGDVRRDARALLGGAYEEFLAKTLPCDAAAPPPALTCAPVLVNWPPIPATGTTRLPGPVAPPAPGLLDVPRRHYARRRGRASPWPRWFLLCGRASRRRARSGRTGPRARRTSRRPRPGLPPPATSLAQAA